MLRKPEVANVCEHVAVPVEVFTPTPVHEAIAVPPLLNVIDPPVGAGDTVAVNVNAVPAGDGFTLDDTTVTVEAGVVCWVILDDWLGKTEAEPEYPATIDDEPEARNDDVVHVAVPPDTTWEEHPEIGAPFAVNNTVPVADDGETVAVNVTGCPAVAGVNPDETDVDDDVNAATVAMVTDPLPVLLDPRNAVDKAALVAHDEPPPPPAPPSP
jgi:hypothetical protein